MPNVLLAAHRAGPRGGVPVVFLGSLASDRSMWDPQVERLAPTTDVIVVELPGHGASPLPPRGSTVADFAAQVLDTLDELGVRACHLVGLSLGGAVAQWLAAHARERVVTLTLLCTATRFGDPDMWCERAALARAEGTGTLATAVVGRWFTAAGPELVERMRAMVTAMSGEAYARSCEALAVWDGAELLPEITAPTMVLAGAQDPSTPPELLVGIAEAIPNSTLHVLDPGAHLVNIERAGEVCELIAAHTR